MYVVLGATGHIGSTVADALLAMGCNVTVVIRNESKIKEWREKGATVAILDIQDSAALSKVFQSAKRAFLLNPPADVSGNTDIEERKTVKSILNALQNSNLEKITLQSTYGAQKGDNCGDLGVLYEFEQGAQKLDIPLCVVHGAYYMSNWLPFATLARNTGKLPSLIPSNLKVPMAAPQDIGHLHAQLLTSSTDQVGSYDIEGPQTYSPRDVVQYLSRVFNKTIDVDEIPQERWFQFFKENGFSDSSASSYANMNYLFITGQYKRPCNPIKGDTNLASYITGEIHCVRD